jgi:hypothetical protein
MVQSGDRAICFRQNDPLPAILPLGPIWLADAQAESLAELLQIFACGEESASLAFAQLGSSPLEEAARRGLACIAEEEQTHEQLLRGLRNALPTPARDREQQHGLLRFFSGLLRDDIGLHLAAIASLDSAVCVILSALLEQQGIIARETSIAPIFCRIRRDEAKHVHLSRRITADLVRRDAAMAVALDTRRDLVDILSRRADDFERLRVGSERLFARLSRLPVGLFQ